MPPIHFGPFAVTSQVCTSLAYPARANINLKYLTSKPPSPVSSWEGEGCASKQVFHSTNLSIALVNVKPLLPGHVLVIPRRVTPRLSDLSHPELSDLFLTVQRVGRMVERVYDASSLNIAVQDGPEAGQSVPHVHAHIIPRKRLDLEARGGGDAIYRMLEGDEGDVGGHLREMVNRGKRPKFPTVEESGRNARSEEEMAEEAKMLAEQMEKTI